MQDTESVILFYLFLGGFLWQLANISRQSNGKCDDFIPHLKHYVAQTLKLISINMYSHIYKPYLFVWIAFVHTVCTSLKIFLTHFHTLTLIYV